MVGEVIVIVLRNCRCVFGQFFYTNNRKACVDGIIWLVKYIIGQINFIINQSSSFTVIGTVPWYRLVPLSLIFPDR
jgi:hypothetical protein